MDSSAIEHRGPELPRLLVSLAYEVLVEGCDARRLVDERREQERRRAALSEPARRLLAELEALEWGGLLSAGHKPATNNFFMYFFVLTGIHAFHLLIGMAVLITLFVLSRKEKLTKAEAEDYLRQIPAV